jgi:two-component system OmpR family response regulator/two-component system response regulator QseB
VHVLVIEDDELLGDALQTGLRERGFAVDWVRDGISADTALRTAEFAAVVLDLGLPRRGGLEVLKAARGRRDAVPVLISRHAMRSRIASPGSMSGPTITSSSPPRWRSSRHDSGR